MNSGIIDSVLSKRGVVAKLAKRFMIPNAYNADVRGKDYNFLTSLYRTQEEDRADMESLLGLKIFYKLLHRIFKISIYKINPLSTA